MCNENIEYYNFKLPYEGTIITGTKGGHSDTYLDNLKILIENLDYKRIKLEWTEWEDCPVFMCKHKVCLALNSNRCFKHTKGLRLWKLIKIWYNNKYKK